MEPFFLRSQGAALLQSTNENAIVAKWTLCDALGRRVADFTTEQERLAVLGSLVNGIYLLSRYDRATGLLLEQSRFFKR